MAAISSLYQDIVFKTAEGYSQHILNGGWVDRKITIPIAVIILVIVFIGASIDVFKKEIKNE